MNKLILSQASVYRLHRLANQVRKVTGVRYKLADNRGLLDLMRTCVFSENTQVRWDLADFVDSLDPDQLQSLKDNGIELSLRHAG